VRSARPQRESYIERGSIILENGVAMPTASHSGATHERSSPVIARSASQSGPATEQVIGIKVAFDHAAVDRRKVRRVGRHFSHQKSPKQNRETFRENAMRFRVLALLLVGFLVGADAAKAGLSTTTRDMSAAIEPVNLTDQSAKEEATQETEDQLGLDRGKRRAVQRQLSRIGFDTRVNGKFDERTRAAITRWQATRGYPATGFLNATQHESLLTESISAANASNTDASDNDNSSPRHGIHRHRVGGPVGVIGGMIGGLFGRR
jgi:hypothetical protein